MIATFSRASGESAAGKAVKRLYTDDQTSWSGTSVSGARALNNPSMQRPSASPSMSSWFGHSPAKSSIRFRVIVSEPMGCRSSPLASVRDSWRRKTWKSSRESGVRGKGLVSNYG